MSTVLHDGERKRPSWDYRGEVIGEIRLLEMMESVRNVLEQIRDKQMLQCDVAQNIAAIAREIRGLRRDLKKAKLA